MYNKETKCTWTTARVELLTQLFADPATAPSFTQAAAALGGGISRHAVKRKVELLRRDMVIPPSTGLRAPRRRSPGTVVVSVEAWLAQHGGARRFEAGASADLISVVEWLNRMGVRARIDGKMARIRGRKVSRERLFAIVDALRAQRGLQPFLAGRAA